MGARDGAGAPASIRVYGRRSAFNVQKVLWGLGELGLRSERVDVGGAFGGLDEPAFLARNPHGRIPVLEDGALVVWESHSILRYLGAAYGEGALWPADPAPRSLADRWMDWTQTALQPDFMALFWGFYRTPEARRDARAIGAALHRCEAHYRLLDAELAGRPWLAGDAFTLGDVPAGCSLYRWYEMGVPVPELPHLRAWYGRLRQRPAYREQVCVPFEELRGRLAF